MGDEGGPGRSFGVVALLIGVIAGYLFCYGTSVRHLRSELRYARKSMHQWEELQRQEREKISMLQELSVAQIEKYVAALDESSRRFLELQNLLNQKELQLAEAPSAYIIVPSAFIAVLLLVTALILRDSNQQAVTTLENVVAMAPDALIRTCLRTRLSDARSPWSLTRQRLSLL
ncbi:MAG: hypothetical protein QGH74_06225 [Candidatus Brocadiia bacterium]|nr:hypothetical protein [Candidatus Brocadiia bacterium]